MKNILLVLLLIKLNTFAQDSNKEKIIPITTSLKVNLNGLRIGVEQKVFKNYTAQLEIGKALEGKSITVKPQIRWYRKVYNENFTYFGLAYFYKHQKTNYNDTLRQLDNDRNFTGTRYTKDFSINKYIHAITLNTGFIHQEKIFNQSFLFEWNIGIGIRYKKSRRYGLTENEDFDLQEAFIIRPQKYQETNGAFKIYPELNLNFSIIIPLIK